MRKTQLLFATVLCFGACGTTNQPSGQEAATADSDEYKFVEDTSRWIVLIQGETDSIGKLDADGNFVPDKRWFQLKKGQPLSSVPPRTLINGFPHKGVYEFRSRRLVPGDLDDSGNFIPTVGGRIIDFKDYHYSPKAPKIYNLPGKFVKNEKKEGQK